MSPTTRKLIGNQFSIVKNILPTTLADAHWMELLNSVYREEGWKNSPHDYSYWRRSFGKDMYSMYYAIHEESQKAVGCASMATYMPLQGIQHQNRPPLSVFGMLYVMGQYRGHGIGKKLFRASMDDCKERHNIFLYGMPNIWEQYTRSDPAFDKLTDWKMLALNAKPEDIDTRRLDGLEKAPSCLKVLHWTKVPWLQLVLYDRKFSMGYDREQYLRQSFEQPDSHTQVLTSDSLTRELEIHGLCRVRRCIDDHIVIGPLYADEPILAKLLLRVALESSPFQRAKSINVHTPNSNLDAVLIFETLTDGNALREIMHPQFTKEVVKFPTEFIYSVSEADNALY